MKLEDIKNPRQKAIIMMFDKEAFEAEESIILDSGEHINGWYDDADTTREELLKECSLSTIEKMYDAVKF